MRSVKMIVGVIAAVLPVGYCGYLLFYFLDTGGSVENAVDMGLGPTILGLGGFGLLFCIPLVFKLIKAMSGPHAPKPGKAAADEAGPGSGFDADAALARYMARRTPEAAAAAAIAAEREVTAPRPTFGRKIG
ncbi:MAG: hypothetical protein V4574_15480 [Pseudomonadota bacterium]